MRTFHTGGIFTANTGKIIYSPSSGNIQNFCLKNTKKLKTIYNEKVLFIKKHTLKIVLKQNNKKAFKINIPKHSLIFVKPNEKVYEKEILAEIPKWKNSLNKTDFFETKTEFGGKSYLKINLKKKKELWILKGNLIKQKKFFQIIFYKKPNNYKEKTKSYNNILIRKIIYYNKNAKYKNNNIYFEINKKDKKYLLILSKKDKKYLLKKKYIFSDQQKITFSIKKNQGQILHEKKHLIELQKGKIYKIKDKDKLTLKNNILIEKNSTIILNTLKTTKTKDIVAGLPKIEQLLEVKKNLNIKNNLNTKLKTYFNLYLTTFNNQKSAEKAIEKIQNNLKKKIHKVYKDQKVNISEKHIEIIIKQMTSKIIITTNINSNLLKGDILDRKKIEKINLTRNIKIEYEPILLGISKISLLNDSFISSASFQETVRILTKSAIMGKLDWLKGLKENIILGNLIPSGTGINN